MAKTDHLFDITEQLCQATNLNYCSIIKNAGIYSTDRPANRFHPDCWQVEGNSNSEVSYAFDLMKVSQAVSSQFKNPKITINRLEIFGSASEKNTLHYHGYRQEILAKGEKSAQFIIFAIKKIAPYDPLTGDILDAFNQRNLPMMNESIKNQYFPVESLPPVILIHEVQGIICAETISTGDIIYMPSGAYHEFAALPGWYAQFASTEVSQELSEMFQASWEEEGRDIKEVIAKTIEKEVGTPVPMSSRSQLTLRDIPSLAQYIELIDKRSDAIGLAGNRKLDK